MALLKLCSEGCCSTLLASRRHHCPATAGRQVGPVGQVGTLDGSARPQKAQLAIAASLVFKTVREEAWRHRARDHKQQPNTTIHPSAHPDTRLPVRGSAQTMAQPGQGRTLASTTAGPATAATLPAALPAVPAAPAAAPREICPIQPSSANAVGPITQLVGLRTAAADGAQVQQGKRTKAACTQQHLGMARNRQKSSTASTLQQCQYNHMNNKQQSEGGARSEGW